MEKLLQLQEKLKIVYHLCTARVALCVKGVEKKRGREEGVPICLYSTANEHCVILLLLHCVSAHVMGEARVVAVRVMAAGSLELHIIHIISACLLLLLWRLFGHF